MTNPSPVKRVVIVGGGTAGWMTAAALAKVTQGTDSKIQLIESESIGTVGVGEASIPSLITFNKMLGIDENQFMAETKGTFKLGIDFVGWGAEGERYFHPFGTYGRGIDSIDFQHWWLQRYNQGNSPDLEEYSLAAQSAFAGKFTRMQPMPDAPFDALAYAFQFDAGLYAQFLRKFSEDLDVERIEGVIEDSQESPESGYIESVRLTSGERIHGDLFIDCSGFRSLLMRQALGTKFVDWSNWLPCNRAVAVACERSGAPEPFTRSTARSAGWQWRIPLQHRNGNGYVYCSDYISDDEATATLLENLDGAAEGNPRQLKFTTGHLESFWEKNCIAIGLSAGFLEPLESTSIHLIQSAIQKLIALYPSQNFEEDKRRIFNERTSLEYQRIRDFLILHYRANRRPEPFWRALAAMEAPPHLARKLTSYQQTGNIFREDDELFSVPSWLAVMHGQGIRTESCHPLTSKMDTSFVKDRLQEVRDGIQYVVGAMPPHGEYLDRYCKVK
ncbi:tryptophan 7-halogenase [Microbulbifer agarilyticus]|uniref:tryptophan halogenase family protein n=1 Tax=Microbulbifer agarilyticus TaxID=260552 RepID=UPI001C95E59B|nr:tryptophan halogenase family protein [Microbulbifer agarilyticus]MBY6191871.1 tryptophan 7-halogenase [Microbulbifer agarilyticus]